MQLPLQEHQFLLCEQYNLSIPLLFLRSMDISTLFVHYLTIFGTFYCKYFYYFRDTPPEEKNMCKYISKLSTVQLFLLKLFTSVTTLKLSMYTNLFSLIIPGIVFSMCSLNSSLYTFRFFLKELNLIFLVTATISLDIIRARDGGKFDFLTSKVSNFFFCL